MKLSSAGMLVAGMLAGAVPLAGTAVAASAGQAASQSEQRPLDEQIAKRIANDPVLKADAIKVTVNGSVVTLSGMVADEADRVNAEQIAMVPGITRVDNKLVTRGGVGSKVKGTAGKAAEKTKAGAGKVGEKSKAVGGKVVDKTKDGWISSRIKTKFMGDESLRESNIQVDADNHIVTLSGTVVSETARDKAIAMAKGVEGVDSVVDKLSVAPKQP